MQVLLKLHASVTVEKKTKKSTKYMKKDIRMNPLRKVNFATKAQKHKEFTKLYFTGYLFFVYLRSCK
jgi:hypothetical protein